MKKMRVFYLVVVAILDCTPAVRQCRLEQSGRGFGFS